MDGAFCVEALKAALARFGRPEIFNTDQGSQFTSTYFTDVLREAEVRISMDGRGRYLNAFETGSGLQTGLGRGVGYYNGQRPPPASPAKRRTRYTGGAFTRMAA